jgi:sterol desaturase/sphingolipid hydroxylase (fatty acid hydroxylase superfamily)
MLWLYLYALFTIPFLTTSGIFYWIDNHAHDARYCKCELRTLKQQYIDYAPNICKNLFLLLPIFIYASVQWIATFAPLHTFTLLDFVLELLFLAFGFETLFFFSHRLLHMPWFLKRVHYKHHEMIHAIGIGAIYCHPFEMFLSNYLPFALPVLLYSYMHFIWPISWIAYYVLGHVVTHIHLQTLTFWTILAGIYIVFSHNGYAFPHKNPKHLVHHVSKMRNFGTLGLWDWYFDTN